VSLNQMVSRRGVSLPCEDPIPFTIHPSRRFPVPCAVTSHEGPFLKLPLATISGFGSQVTKI